MLRMLCLGLLWLAAPVFADGTENDGSNGATVTVGSGLIEEAPPDDPASLLSGARTRTTGTTYPAIPGSIIPMPRSADGSCMENADITVNLGSGGGPHKSSVSVTVLPDCTAKILTNKYKDEPVPFGPDGRMLDPADSSDARQ